MKIAKRVILIVFFVILFILTLFIGNFVRLLILEQRDDIKLKMSDVRVAGNRDHYIPQGLTYSKKYKVMIQTSYNKDKKISKIYISNFTTGRLEKELKLVNSDDTENISHVGGITTDENKVWITSDFTVWEYSLDEIMTTTNDYVKSIREDELPIRGDFCTYTENKLWIGDFFLNPFYKVPDNMPLLLQYSTIIEENPPAETTTEENTETEEENSEESENNNFEENIEENIDEPMWDKPKGIDFGKPAMIFSLPKEVQGMVIFENKEENTIDFYCDGSFTYLVQSYFMHYKLDLKDENKEEFDFYGNKKDFYRFEKAEVLSYEKMPPMAEGMVYSDRAGKKEIYILFESDSDAYKLAAPKMNRIMKYWIERKKVEPPPPPAESNEENKE